MADPIRDALSLLDSHPCSEARHLHRVAIDALLRERDAVDLLAEYVAIDEGRVDYPGIYDNEGAERLIRARAVLGRIGWKEND